MGRHKKKHVLKVLGGTERKPRKRPTAKAAPGEPTCPTWLGADGKREWRRVVKELAKLGLLTTLDRTTLADYCMAFQEWRTYKKQEQKEGSFLKTDKGYTYPHPCLAQKNNAEKRMLVIARQLGLTPASRALIKVEKPDDTEDPMEGFLKGKKA